MSLRIPGAPPPATPMIRRDEAPRRAAVSSGEAPASAPARTAVVEPTEDQWVSSAEASTAAAALSAPTVAPEGAAAYGSVTAEPDTAPNEAALVAERVNRDILARPPQAAGAHGNLVAATVLNLLA